MSKSVLEAHFEVYTLRDGRWMLDRCAADEDEARLDVARLSHATGVRGVRLLREVRLPDLNEPIVTVLADTTADNTANTICGKRNPRQHKPDTHARKREPTALKNPHEAEPLPIRRAARVATMVMAGATLLLATSIAVVALLGGR